MRLLTASAITIALTITALPGEGAQVVGTTTATPTTAPVGVGTVVTVVSAISDPSLLPSSVLLQRIDAAGRVLATLGVPVDNGSGGDAVAGDGLFTIRTTIFETISGPVILRVSAAFQGKLTRALSAPVTITVAGTATTLRITSPGNLAYVNTTPLQVSGTMGDPAAAVTVNGIAATSGGGTFLATVPLLEGTNTLTAVATNSNGSTTTASVQVTLDTTPPRLTVTEPSDGLVTIASTVAVSGLINDIVVGTINDQQATVQVNGVPAQVANRSFLAAAVPLALGPNVIQVTGTDRTGNGATTSVTVTRVVPTTPTIRVVSGSNQSALAGTNLAAPLVAQVTNTAGVPVAGLDVPAAAIERGLTSLAGVPGRFEMVSSSADDIVVVIDYAHTDDALKNLLETARPLAERRVITVFGCGGDRDRTKRPLMGAVAARLSDIVVITSDNPRTEDPARIIEEIKRGVPTASDRAAATFAIPDRKEAIQFAIRKAEPGDLVLLAGKGHEQTQLIGSTELPFDEAAIARDALERRR
jgi:hypothetical protein